MTLYLYCNLCQCILNNPNVRPPSRYTASWHKNFRVIYSSPAGISISGVGLYDDGVTNRCFVPLEYTVRWDDSGYSFPQDDEIGVLNGQPVNGRYGFVFHEACWLLLEIDFYPARVPVARLYEVCRSLPLPKSIALGGWAQTLEIIRQDLRISQCAESPFNFLHIRRLVQNAPGYPPGGTLRSCPASGNSDVFSTIPQEMRDTIASLLSTADVCHLRLASRAFVSIFSNQQFWLSRFQRGGERSWLYEVHFLRPRGFRNWRSLYRCTNPVRVLPAVMSRRQVCGLVWRIREILDLRWNEEATHPSPVTQMPAAPWREASARLRLPRGSSGFGVAEGCWELRTRTINISERLAQVSFSILDHSGTMYVTGMRVTTADGTTQSIGYSANKSWCSEPVTSLNGFKLAIGECGIEGIRVIHGDGTASRWFGSADRAPHTHRLVCSKGISALSAGFDDFKMVRLSVQEAGQPDPVDPNHQISLLHTALWYPDVPPHGLHFSDFRNGTPPPDYAPLRWAHFGGPAGIHLRGVCGISVKVNPVDRTIRSIQVLFKTSVPDACDRILGIEPFGSLNSQAMSFSVDGPGGEIIERVWWSEGGPRVSGLEMTTNRGRSVQFGRFMENSPENKHALEIPVGHTITGFYANIVWDHGLTGIGVMSELVDSF